jgi:hypothetical protein
VVIGAGFAQNTTTICTTHIERSLKGTDSWDTTSCFDYEIDCWNWRDSLHIYHKQLRKPTCSWRDDELTIQFEENESPKLVQHRNGAAVDSLFRTNGNEFERYIRSPENKLFFDGKYIFTDSTIEIYSPNHVSWWGDPESTDIFYDHQNYLHQTWCFSDGYLVKSFFREVFQGKESNNSETTYSYTTYENSTTVFVHERSSSLGTQNKEILVDIQGEYRISKFTLLSFIDFELGFDLMYSSIFPVTLYYQPNLLDMHN